MKKVIVLAIALIAGSITNQHAQAQLKLSRHGFTINAGTAHLYNLKTQQQDNTIQLIDESTGMLNQNYYANVTLPPKIKYSIALGYKLRFNKQNAKLFLDLDANTTLRKIQTSSVWYGTTEDNTLTGYAYSSNIYSLNLSLNPTVNYKFYEEWYIGAGLAPTLYYHTDGHLSLDLDAPITAKIGFDFEYLDISFNYQYGINGKLQQQGYGQQGRINNWYVQVFLPF